MEPAGLVHESKRLARLLRHRAAESGLELDRSGWARVDDVLRTLGMSRAVLDEVVSRNDKRRPERRAAGPPRPGRVHRPGHGGEP